MKQKCLHTIISNCMVCFSLYSITRIYEKITISVDTVIFHKKEIISKLDPPRDYVVTKLNFQYNLITSL